MVTVLPTLPVNGLTEETVTTPLQVTGFIALYVPHVLTTEYFIVSDPVLTPVTIPVVAPTLAMDVFVLDHVPPVVASVKVSGEPTHTMDDPLIAETTTGVTTAIETVSTLLPQALLVE